MPRIASSPLSLRRSGLKRDQIFPGSRLVQDLKLDGDDAIDALLEIAMLSGMDVSGFNAGLYFRSEPNLLSIFRYKSAPKKEITVGQLIDAGRRGQLYQTALILTHEGD
jgi:hypothetical protein